VHHAREIDDRSCADRARLTVRPLEDDAAPHFLPVPPSAEDKHAIAVPRGTSGVHDSIMPLVSLGRIDEVSVGASIWSVTHGAPRTRTTRPPRALVRRSAAARRSQLIHRTVRLHRSSFACRGER
jgi:hypothetical protein